MTRIIVVANQKGGVGKTTLTMNLAAVTYDALVQPGPIQIAAATAVGDPDSPVAVANTDPQASSVWWSNRVEKSDSGLPFDFVQVANPRDLAKLRQLGKAYIFVDTPGSLEDAATLTAALDEADEVLVPMPPEPLAFSPTTLTIDKVVAPRGLPFKVIVNNWDPRDGIVDLQQTAEYIQRRGWPACNTVVRRYKIHTRASAAGQVVTQYPKGRPTMEAREDFYKLALELGYGGGHKASLPAQASAPTLRAV